MALLSQLVNPGVMSLGNYLWTALLATRDLLRVTAGLHICGIANPDQPHEMHPLHSLCESTCPALASPSGLQVVAQTLAEHSCMWRRAPTKPASPRERGGYLDASWHLSKSA